MKYNLSRFFRLFSVAALMFVFILTSTSVFAAQKVPISFDDYHGYNGTVQYVKDVAKAYPNITALLEIGEKARWGGRFMCWSYLT